MADVMDPAQVKIDRRRRWLGWTFLAAGLLLSGASGASYWIHSLLRYPDNSVWDLLLHRFGNAEYFSFLFSYAQGNFGEPSNWATFGQGVYPFPYGSMLPHIAGIAIFGPWGFALADVAVALGRFFAFAILARPFLQEPHRVYGMAAVLSVLSGPAIAALPDFWTYEFPRPYVTSLWLLLGIAALLRAFLALAGQRRWHCLAGASSALLLQGEPHAAASLAVAVIIVLLLDWHQRRHFSSAWFWGLASALLFLLPMGWQLLHAPPDLVARWGRFTAEPWPPLFFLSPIGSWAIAAALLALVLEWRWPLGGKAWLLPALAAILPLALAAAVPITWLVMAGGIQAYHFAFAEPNIAAASYLLLCLWVVCRLLALPPLILVENALAVRSPIVTLALAGLLFWFIPALHDRSVRWAVEIDHQSQFSEINTDPTRAQGYPRMPGYRDDFQALWQELSDPRYDKARVLASYDADWRIVWLAAGRGGLYMPDNWATLLPQEEIEQRILSFARFMGVDQARFSRWLETDYFILRLFGHFSYQASSRFKPFPDDFYSPEQLAFIHAQDPLWQAFVPIVPQKEQARLLAQLERAPLPKELPDLIITVENPPYDGLMPPETYYLKTYQGRWLAIWLRRDLL